MPSSFVQFDWILGRDFADEDLFQEAEKLQREVLEKTTTELGRDHPNALTSMANLASTDSYRGRWEEAEELET